MIQGEGPISTIRIPATDMFYNNTSGHHQRTSSQQFYNKYATSQCQSPTSRHVRMLGCGKFLSVGGEFVVQQAVEFLSARPLVVSVDGVRVVEFGTKETAIIRCHTSHVAWERAVYLNKPSGGFRELAGYSRDKIPTTGSTSLRRAQRVSK